MIESGRLAHRGPFPEEFLLMLSVLLDFFSYCICTSGCFDRDAAHDTCRG